MRDVVVVGAGPVGMLMAGDLARSGHDVEVLERRLDAGWGSRAIGVHAPVLAALERTGATERILAHAMRVPRGEARSGGQMLGVVRFDRLSTRFPFVATLPQARTDEALAVDAPLPARGTEVTRIRERGDRVLVQATKDGRRIEIEARAVVVASGTGGRELVFRPDAARSAVYRDRYVMADVVVGDRPDAATATVHLDPQGVLESFPLPGGVRRFVAWDDPDASREPAALADRLRAALAARDERDAAERVTAATGFAVRRFVAPRLRNGRIIVIGDAAHEVSPIGGQGMNLGLLDAATLAPLLSEWMHTGHAPDTALGLWEQRRVRSATTAARLAAVNTRLGRPLSRRADAARRSAVRAMLAGPSGRLFARAYAMGLDADA